MTGAPPSEWRCRQDDVCVARRWSVDTAGQARGRIQFKAFRRCVAVVDTPREMLEGAVPEHGAVS